MQRGVGRNRCCLCRDLTASGSFAPLLINRPGSSGFCCSCGHGSIVSASVWPSAQNCDLASRQDKSSEGLLSEILDPNRAVDQRYAEYVAVTTDGVVTNGILVAESSNSISLRPYRTRNQRICAASSNRSQQRADRLCRRVLRTRLRRIKCPICCRSWQHHRAR